MIATLWGAFLASLAGSLHCVGMCGGLVAAYAGHKGRSGVQEHVAYHGMRLLAYATLGAVAGAIGASVDLASVAVGLGPIAVALAGVTMIMAGLLALARLAGWQIPHLLKTPLAVGRGLSRLTRFGAGRGPVMRAGILGLSSALLPCGWLWAFVVAAAGAGTLAGGALIMVAFWAGTVPALTGLGVGLKLLAGRLGSRVSAIGAIAVIAIGLWTLYSRSLIPGPMGKTVASTSAVNGADANRADALESNAVNPGSIESTVIPDKPTCCSNE